MRELKEKKVEILVYFENSLKFKLRINFHDFFSKIQSMLHT
jgi:hypothetical protein